MIWQGWPIPVVIGGQRKIIDAEKKKPDAGAAAVTIISACEYYANLEKKR